MRRLLYFTITVLFCSFASPGCINSKQTKDPDPVTIENQEYFRVVLGFIDEGRSVIVPSKGESMLPMIQDGDAMVMEPVDPKSIQRFDVVLYEPEPGYYFVNRVVKISNHSVTIMGDASTESGTFDITTIRARISAFVSDDKAYSLDSREARRWASDWFDQKGKKAALLESVTQQQVLSQLPEGHTVNTGFTSAGQQYESFRKYRKSSNIIEFSMDGYDALVKDENPIDLRKVISLNETALFLWYNAEDSFNPSSLAKLLTDNYEVSYTIAYNDCVALVKDWLSIGVIEYAN